MIFVFGSNLKGIHGAGAAAYAYKHYGAIWKQGEGLQGQSYALPTCSAPGVPLSLEDIQTHVDEFLRWAAFAETALPNEHVLVTRVGCGLAGYRDDQIAPMFIDAPDNVWLPAVWAKTLYNKGMYDGSLQGMIKAAEEFERQREDLDPA